MVLFLLTCLFILNLFCRFLFFFLRHFIYGVPQDSILRPSLLSIYIHSQDEIISRVMALSTIYMLMTPCQIVSSEIVKCQVSIQSVCCSWHSDSCPVSYMTPPLGCLLNIPQLFVFKTDLLTFHLTPKLTPLTFFSCLLMAHNSILSFTQTRNCCLLRIAHTPHSVQWKVFQLNFTSRIISLHIFSNLSHYLLL